MESEIKVVGHLAFLFYNWMDWREYIKYAKSLLLSMVMTNFDWQVGWIKKYLEVGLGKWLSG